MNLDHIIKLHLGERTDYYSAGQVDDVLARAIGASSGEVLLSHHTIQKQIKNHPEIALDHYQALRPCIGLGEAWHIGDRKMALILVDTVLFSANFRAILKATKSGGEIFVISFHQMRDSKIRQFRRSLIRKNCLLLREHAETE